MDLNTILANLGGAGAVLGSVLAALRSKKVKAFVSKVLTDSDFAVSLESLQSVVEAQGESIEWLRSELEHTRTELEVARDRLKATEDLSVENSKLKTRIAELELQVQHLEEELRRRRGGRPKKQTLEGL